MTKLICRSERDIAALERVRGLGAASSMEQPASYRNLVVLKPWGYEFLMFQNSAVAAWYLHIDKGHATSMHCHPRKKTALMVLSGHALCNTFYNRNYLHGVDSVVIEAGVFHSTKSLSAGGIDLIEIETPPDKTDLVRLNDQYGREANGYEGMSEMRRTDLERYGYFWFHDPYETKEAVLPQQRGLRNGVVSLIPCSDGKDFREMFVDKRGEFYCCCRGRIVDGDGSVVLDVGDSADASFLDTFDALRIEGPALLLKVVSGQ